MLEQVAVIQRAQAEVLDLVSTLEDDRVIQLARV
jgi:hypothetical protein